MNTNALKRALKDLKYLYQVNKVAAYRVYSEYRDTLFAEKVNEQYGTADNREDAVCAGTLCMLPPLGNDLPVEMRQLLDQPDILEQRRST
jgi:hypothetical protein